MEEHGDPAPARLPVLRVCTLFLLVSALLALLSAAPLVTRAQEAPPRLLISEVMVEPVALDDLGEWVEIANLGGAPVDLAGWQLRTAQGRTIDLPLQTTLPAGSYGVFAERASAVLESLIPLAGLIQSPGLATQDGLALLAPDGTVVDETHWGDDPPVQPGHSLERTGPEPDAWAVAWLPFLGGIPEWGSPGLPWQPPPTPTPAPSIRISEVMADPAAAPDDVGEWIELWNPNPYPVDLVGWLLADGRGDPFALAALTLAPGGYSVLGRSADLALNGGAPVDALFPTTLQLANDGGTLRLLTPGGGEVDAFAWDAALCLPGRSIERMDEGLRSAVLPWPGSLGDWGSPGAPAPPAPPATPTPSPTPTLSPTPTHPPSTPTLTPTAMPDAWPAPLSDSPLQFDEVGYRGESAYIVLMNTSARPVDLRGWSLGDSARPADGEGMLLLPDVRVPAGGAFLLAQDGAAFARRWLVAPDAQVRETAPGVPVLAALPGFHSGDFSLSDSGDELLLLAPDGRLADALVFGSGDGAPLQIDGALSAGEGKGLARVEGVRWPTVRDIRHRFIVAPEDPLLRRALPAPAPHASLPLGDGLFAWWGGLGSPTTFSAEGTLPPLALVAETAALGLDFIAPADPQPHSSLPFDPPITLLPSWLWESNGDRAIVYGAAPEMADRWALLAFADATDTSVQWLRDDWLPYRPFRILPADRLASAQEAAATLPERWRAAGMPLLPAGNSPALPFAGESAARYTGLAAPDPSAGALLEALRARRGWMATTPGLALALAAQTQAGTVWMGSALDPANTLTLRVVAQDQGGQPLTVTLWQEESAVATWEAAPGAPPHTLNLFAAPDLYLYVTATRADGAFAVSAPLYVRPNHQGQVVIAEVLADPTSDLDGDGRIDEGDEFIELYNAGELPVSLEGWQLFDSRGARSGEGRHAFAPGATIAAHARLLLWRAETGLALNNGGERVYLSLPGGGEADVVGWDELGEGLAAARSGDGGWLYGVAPTPGEATSATAAESAAVAMTVALPATALSAASAPEENAVPPAPAIQIAPAEAAPELSTAAEVLAAPVADSIERARQRGIEVETVVRGVVTLEPGRLHSLIYLAQPGSQVGDGMAAGPGLRVYLPWADFPALREGDWVEARGLLQSFRGERELRPAGPSGVVRLEAGAPLLPQSIVLGQVGEEVEGRLVRFEGVIASTDGDSLFLADPASPGLPPVRVLVARSLGWPPPVAAAGERWQVTGIVSQSARAAPWNGGYRVLVRAPADLVRLR